MAQAEDNCSTDFNAVSYSRFGRETRLPELWLYGDEDRFYATWSILAYRDAFQRSGGSVQFHLFRNVPGGGHGLGPAVTLWTADLGRYLRTRKLLD